MNASTRTAPCPQSHSGWQLRCSIAQTPQEREEVYQLRHEAYRRDGAIDRQPGDRFSDHFDTLPNSFSLVLRRNDTAAKATVRISVLRPDLGWTEAPSRHVFGEHPALEAMATESYVEASRLCFGPRARRDVFVKLVGHMAALSDVFETSWLVACPRVEHAHVYKSLFGFRQLAEPRQYYGVHFQTELLGVRREEMREHVRHQKRMLMAWSDALESLRCLFASGSAAQPPVFGRLSSC
jgi:hypothetical protein